MCLQIDFNEWGLGYQKFFFYADLKKFANAEITNSKGFLDAELGTDGKVRFWGVSSQMELWQGFRCVYTNLATILNEIRGSYDKNGMGECELLDRLQAYDFAFIDDFGKEFLGREYNASSSKWAEEKLFEVINARYNAQKPTIFSSNYEISELASVLNLDKAIVERVNEMATRTLKLEGDDFRSTARQNKSELAKKLGI